MGVYATESEDSLTKKKHINKASIQARVQWQ